MENYKYQFTIFTPTYNRAYRLKALYESLRNQTNKNFEWVIIDDGSTDGTNILVKELKEERLIDIVYHFQENQGKHIAINRGVEIAQGELFFIVDSDDIIPEYSLSTITHYFNAVKSIDNIAGVVGRKAYFDKKKVGNLTEFNTIISNAVDIRYKEHLEGDLGEVFRTEVLREFPFPKYNNEKFCTESLVWNRIALKYNLLFFDEPIYFCEYLEDGLSSKVVKIRMTSPIAAMTTYAELSKLKIPLLQKIKANINFWRFSFNSDYSLLQKTKLVSLMLSVLGYPLGYILYTNDKIKNK